MNPPISLIRINPSDNVAVAVRQIESGEAVSTAEGDSVTLSGPAGYGFKVALRGIPCGAAILKYGEDIGTATVDIAPGDVVHTHNVKPLALPDVFVNGT